VTPKSGKSLTGSGRNRCEADVVEASVLTQPGVGRNAARPCSPNPILPEEHRARIFDTKTPHSPNTFLVDGHVAGSWRHEDGEIRLDPSRRCRPWTGRAVEQEAHGLARLHAE